MKKILLALLTVGLLTACGGETDTEEPKVETVTEETSEQTDQEETEEEEKEETPYEEIAKYAFGKDVKCDVIEGWGDDNKPKVTRINITTSGEPMVDPFLIDVFSYLKKVKENELDYESVFFILRSEKTDGKEYPYAKIEIAKEAADNFDFNTKDPVDLKSIAETYDAPDANEISEKTNIKSETSSKDNLNTENLSNEDAKTIVAAFITAQFEDMCDVSTETIDDSFIIHLYPKDPDLKTEIAGLMIDKTNPQLLAGWNEMSKGIVELSKNVKEQIDENVSIMLHNPVNTENVLFVTLNDIVFSDFTKE